MTSEYLEKVIPALISVTFPCLVSPPDLYIRCRPIQGAAAVNILKSLYWFPVGSEEVLNC